MHGDCHASHHMQVQVSDSLLASDRRAAVLFPFWRSSTCSIQKGGADELDATRAQLTVDSGPWNHGIDSTMNRQLETNALCHTPLSKSCDIVTSWWSFLGSTFYTALISRRGIGSGLLTRDISLFLRNIECDDWLMTLVMYTSLMWWCFVRLTFKQNPFLIVLQGHLLHCT